MKRAIVNVATGERYRKGAVRLEKALAEVEYVGGFFTWPNIPTGWPTHEENPYAFKCRAMMEAVKRDFYQIMWCDACILPIRSLEPIWAYAEQHGAWISKNGWSNYEWTADSAYPDLFPEIFAGPLGKEDSLEVARNVNRECPHVVATAFALDLRHPAGNAIFDEYCRLGLETRAFCGPWINSSWKNPTTGLVAFPMGPRAQPCGPPDVRGHRHDQTALSVCAWRAGVPLTTCPKFFSYPPPGWSAADPLKGLDERTILVADGSYV